MTIDHSNLHPSQKKALEQAWDLLSEHFDHFVLAIDWQANHPNGGETGHARLVLWHGGSTAAVGLSRIASLASEQAAFQDDA